MDCFNDFIKSYIKENWIKCKIEVKNIGKRPTNNIEVCVEFEIEVYIYKDFPE